MISNKSSFFLPLIVFCFSADGHAQSNPWHQSQALSTTPSATPTNVTARTTTDVLSISNQQRWKTTFYEDFKGYDPTDPCYTMDPYIKKDQDHLVQETQWNDHLKRLNKCIWTTWELPDLWSQEKGLQPGQFRQWFDPSMVIVEDGLLRLKADFAPDHYHIYASSIDSLGDDNYNLGQPIHTGFQQTFGRFESFVKVDSLGGPGPWPASWLTAAAPQSLNGSPVPPWPGLAGWPFNGELDLMEFFSSNNIIGETMKYYGQTYHYGDPNAPNASNQTSSQIQSQIHQLDNLFHVYATEWTPDYILFEADGAVTQTIPRSALPLIPHDPMFWIEGNAFSADYIGQFFATEYQVKWIRSYQLCDPSSTDPKCLDKATLSISVTPFPNPVQVNHGFKLKVTSNRACSELWMQVYSSNGRVVFATSRPVAIGNEIVDMPLSHLAPGNYFGRFSTRGCTLVDSATQGTSSFTFVVL